ncbi:GMC oxidoreductase [Kribbella flavida DSM 17836]|uniref:Cholesterol oxidase n=1 Tax=Kribbella flavida (strain DSM 17836 / JCM 10339 / NBRC 14399) TaxID=479435 RepID=D2PR11_KRIFD|nr:GMC family oxidoreductase [Kribbella flavida]ADB32959.1 GMC oxidoreductase [Kribbella flavida DSM 17836]
MEYDAVVVGTGFGGAVAAARLAQADLRVAVLERGRRWPRGSFPRNDADLKDGWLWRFGRGLYDVRWLDQMISVQAAGWGGGSLVYANVFARPPADVFDDHWPSSYTRDTLAPYYDLAAHMLEVRPVTPDPATGHYPSRTAAMQLAVDGMGRPAGTVRPNLAVRFTDDPEVLEKNRHGAEQFGCTFLAECVLGCNRGAKNSLDLNYLTVAENAGVEARTGCEVTGIEPVEGGYRVRYLDHEQGESRTVTGSQVWLGAGAVGTTELLLRARDVARTLPRLSPALGNGFSGNGDFLAFVRRTKTPLDPDHGPTITTTSIVDCEIDGRRLWFQVQDGSYPRRLALLVAGLNPAHAPVEAIRGWTNRFRSGPRRGDNLMTLLLMGRDSSDGRLKLDHKAEAAVDWKYLANKDLYAAQSRASRAVARQLSGRTRLTPTWRFLKQAVTVHNLGGTPMGADPATAVIDEDGEVHGYPGLFVVDGAAVPGATGTNPSATITAMAERMVEHAIRRRLGDENWHAPELPDVVPADVPEDAAMLAMARARVQTVGHGVRFQERMTGRAHFPDGNAVVDLRLSVRLAGWKPFTEDSRHRLTVSGTVTVGAIATAAEVTGTLALFPDGDAVAMQYDLGFLADDGREWGLRGVKNQRTGNPLALWGDLTTLSFEVHPVEGERLGSGTVRISTPGVLSLGLSLRGEAYSRRDRLAARARFAGFFATNALRGLTGRR